MSRYRHQLPLAFSQQMKRAKLNRAARMAPFTLIYAAATLTWFWMHAGHALDPSLLLQQQLSEVLEDPQRISMHWQARRCKAKSNQAYLFSSEDCISNLFGENNQGNVILYGIVNNQQPTRRFYTAQHKYIYIFPHICSNIFLAIVIRDAGQEWWG